MTRVSPTHLHLVYVHALSMMSAVKKRNRTDDDVVQPPGKRAKTTKSSPPVSSSVGGAGAGAGAGSGSIPPASSSTAFSSSSQPDHDDSESDELDEIDVEDIVPLSMLAHNKSTELKLLTDKLDFKHPRFIEQVAARQKHVLSLATDLFKQHKLDGWSCIFDNSKTRAGLCDSRCKTIHLSAMMVQQYFADTNGLVKIRDTILHEIAHALTPPEFKQTSRGPVAVHHGPAWKAAAVRVGARPERCHSMDFSGGPRYFLKCTTEVSEKYPKCGWSSGCKVQPKRWRFMKCKHCDEKLVLEVNKDFQGSGFVMRKS
jgi:predicted SprT family Zn-dependent metalloprotease